MGRCGGAGRGVGRRFASYLTQIHEHTKIRKQVTMANTAQRAKGHARDKTRHKQSDGAAFSLVGNSNGLESLISMFVPH